MGSQVAEKYIYEFTGDPKDVDPAIINPPIGALIIDPTNGNLRRKTTGFNDNSGFEIIGTMVAPGALLTEEGDKMTDESSQPITAETS